MADIRVLKTPIDGLVVIEPTKFGDDRGYFMKPTILRLFISTASIWVYPG